MRKLYRNIYDKENYLYIKLQSGKIRHDFNKTYTFALMQPVEIKWKYFIKKINKPFWDYENAFIELNEYNEYVKKGLIK